VSSFVLDRYVMFMLSTNLSVAGRYVATLALIVRMLYGFHNSVRS